MAFKRSGVRTPPGSTNFYHLINGLKESALADVIERGRMGKRRRDALTKHATRRCPTDTPWSQRPRRDAQPDISAYDALALMPTDKAAFSYQPKDLKSVCRGVRARFLLDEFLGREPTDLPWTFRDTLRLTFVSLGRKTRFLVARLRHQINGEVSRQVIGCQAGLLGHPKGAGDDASEREIIGQRPAQSTRRQENHHAAKTSYGSRAVLCSSPGLIVRVCHVS